MCDIIVNMVKRASLSRRLKDRRFRKNEGMIVKVFVKKKGDLTARKIAKETGLSRSTVYEHHHAMKEIIPDYERYILGEYSLAIRKRMRRKNVPLKALYFDTLLFILRNRKIFEMFLKFNDKEIVVRMVGKMKSKIVGSQRLPKNSDGMFRIYAVEVAEVIFGWGERGFSEEELSRVLNDILYLTETCGDRLGPINH